MKRQIIVTVLHLALLMPVTQGKKVFCYYSSFAHTRHGVGNFLPENINPRLCSHLIYAFVEISPDGSDLIPFNRNDLGPKGMYSRTLALKSINPDLKVLLAVGGWQIGSKPFIPMIKDEAIRNKWIKNVVRYLRNNGFDGFDVDWEFPATRGSPPEDKYRFTALLKGLHEAFAQEAIESGKEKLILTLAAASGTFYIDQSYEPKKIINYIDYMLLMTYNYHGQWEKITGHHSGLLAHRDDPKTGEKSQLYQEWSIDYWLDMGISKDKLIVGIPTYAMTYTLADPSLNSVHSPAVGGGKMGEFTRETGILAYYEICRNVMNKGWKSEWIEDQKVPYAYGDDQWAGYENRKSIAMKANNIIKRGLAGAFVWSIEMDDFNGVCGEGPYPLLSTITTILDDNLSKSAASHSKDSSSKKINQFNHSKPSQPMAKKINTNHLEEKSSEEDDKTDDDSQEDSSQKSDSYSSSEKVGKKQEVKKVRWWSGTIRQKSPSWKSVTTAKPAGEIAAKETNQKQSLLWKRKGSKNNIPDDVKEQSGKVTIVKPWHGLHWWSPGNGQRKTKTSPDLFIAKEGRGKGASLTTIAPSPRPSMLAAYMGVIDARSDVCRKHGIGAYADPMSCDHFIICLSGNWMDIPPHVMACPVGTRFDANLRICNYASNVDCQN